MELSNLLINEPPLQVLPSLAKKIGLNEAIILQQIHYWLGISKKKHDGKVWTYNSASEWKKQFPFWSESTIRRAVKNLRDNGLIDVTSKYNRMPMDKTLWYTINYDNVDRLSHPCSQNDQTMLSKCTDDVVKMDRAIPENYTENNTNTTTTAGTEYNSDFSRVLNHYQNNISYHTSETLNQTLEQDIEEYGADLVIHAMDEAVLNNVLNYRYVTKILETWKREHVTTVEQAIVRSKQWEEKKTRKTSGGKTNGTNQDADYIEKFNQGIPW